MILWTNHIFLKLIIILFTQTVNFSSLSIKKCRNNFLNRNIGNLIKYVENISHFMKNGEDVEKIVKISKKCRNNIKFIFPNKWIHNVKKY